MGVTANRGPRVWQKASEKQSETKENAALERGGVWKGELKEGERTETVMEGQTSVNQSAQLLWMTWVCVGGNLTRTLFWKS